MTTLSGSSTALIQLPFANVIANLGSFTTNNSGLALTDASSLTVTGAVNVGSSYMVLTTTGAGSNLAVDAPLTGTAVELNAAGAVSQNSAGIITTDYFLGSSTGATTLTANNAIGELEGFTTGNGDFTLTDTLGLQVTSALNVGTGKFPR